MAHLHGDVVRLRNPTNASPGARSSRLHREPERHAAPHGDARSRHRVPGRGHRDVRQPHGGAGPLRLDGRAWRSGLQRVRRQSNGDGERSHGHHHRRDGTLCRSGRRLPLSLGVCDRRGGGHHQRANHRSRGTRPDSCDQGAGQGGNQGRQKNGERPSGGGVTGLSPEVRRLGKQLMPFALAVGLWLAPVPAGLTAPAWHLFAIFAAAIFSVIVAAFPLLTAAMMAVAAAVLTGTITPAKAFAGFANASVLLVIVAFLVARGVVKSGLGRRISLVVVSAFGGSTLGLAYSIFFTDAVIAPAFPSNTARGGVLFPIVLSLAQGAGSKAEDPDPDRRRLGGYLMFCGMASLSVSSALWLTGTSANPIGVEIAERYGLQIGFGSWLVAACVPALAAILILPAALYRLLPPGVSATPGATAAARKTLQALGPLSRDEWIVTVAFVIMVTGWALARPLRLDLTAVAFAGLAALLATSVLTIDDIAQEGPTLITYLWLVVLYVLMHYLFVSQSSQVLALFGVFVEVGMRTGVPTALMAWSLLFASSYFSTLTPQGGSQNVIFVGSGYLTQGELYRVGAITTGLCLLVFLLLGTPWLLLVAR